MEESLKVDKDLVKAFNQGYELAKKLNMTSPMFRDLNPNIVRLNAMQAGMTEFCNEIAQAKRKNLGLKSNRGIESKKDKGKGFNLSM